MTFEEIEGYYALAQDGVPLEQQGEPKTQAEEQEVTVQEGPGFGMAIEENDEPVSTVTQSIEAMPPPTYRTTTTYTESIPTTAHLGKSLHPPMLCHHELPTRFDQFPRSPCWVEDHRHGSRIPHTCPDR